MVGILTLRELCSKEELPDIVDTTLLEILICLPVEVGETAEGRLEIEVTDQHSD